MDNNLIEFMIHYFNKENFNVTSRQFFNLYKEYPGYNENMTEQLFHRITSKYFYKKPSSRTNNIVNLDEELDSLDKKIWELTDLMDKINKIKEERNKLLNSRNLIN